MENNKVETYIEKPKKWFEEIKALREIMLKTDLDEEFKWGKPCYTYNKKPVVIIYELKNDVGIGFWKGVLMKDRKNIMHLPGENSKSVKMIKFTNLDDIKATEETIEEYVKEAIEIEEKGLKVDFGHNEELVLVEELQEVLDDDEALRTAFKSLTPGRQRAYNLFISSAKQSTTRFSRIEKYREKILSGKGMND